MRIRYVYRDGKFVEDTGQQPAAEKNAPHIIQDTISPTWHPADGKTYDSRTQFDRVTKAHGLENVSGDKNFTKLRPKLEFGDPGQDVAHAIEALESGSRDRSSYEAHQERVQRALELLKD